MIPIPIADSWRQNLLKLKELSVFRGVLRRPLLQELLAAVEKDEPAPVVWGRWMHLLTRERLLWASPALKWAADPWEAWLIEAVLCDDNLWTGSAEKGDDPGELFSRLAQRDLDLLSQARDALRVLSAQVDTSLIWHASHEEARAFVPFAPRRQARSEMIQSMAEGREWGSLAPTLAGFFKTSGAGLLNLAYTFRWDGELRPILNPDPVRLEDLTGYESEREQVIANTDRLVRGLPAHNLLLYGDRGTGKSATVKGLAHRFADQGLRLVEVPKSALDKLPGLLDELGRRGLPIIVFVDDLSFEADETDYKELKACLEGSLQVPAANVRLYATSNRRHLIKEQFSERAGGAWGTADDDVRRQDSIQEKLSLADRFGMTVIFPSPSQKEYLEIVYALADRHGLEIDRQRLTTMALRWASWQNGRSARTARQFVESLIGEPLPEQAM